MRVVTKGTLRTYWELPAHRDSEVPLRFWYDTVSRRSTDWHRFVDVQATFGSASLYKDCVVFNIGGNNYRLITRIRYDVHKVFIVQVLTHPEYDKGLWKSECQCRGSE